jgi:hypothetical protein
MQSTVYWHVGSDGGSSRRLDKPPFRAYFFWVQDGLLIDAADYSVDELQRHLADLQQSGQDTSQVLDALSTLRRANQ